MGQEFYFEVNSIIELAWQFKIDVSFVRNRIFFAPMSLGILKVWMTQIVWCNFELVTHKKDTVNFYMVRKWLYSSLVKNTQVGDKISSWSQWDRHIMLMTFVGHNLRCCQHHVGGIKNLRIL